MWLFLSVINAYGIITTYELQCEGLEELPKELWNNIVAVFKGKVEYFECRISNPYLQMRRALSGS